MDARRTAPSTARNRDPILAVLKRVLRPDARVLEIASGAGEHAVYFASALPNVVWQPSDPDADARASIAAWIAAEKPPNVCAPLALDAGEADWGAGAAFDAVVAINMIHIAPWRTTLGLLAGAGRVIADGGVLVTYGPYMRDGAHTASSNAAFDASLRARNEDWGVRDMADVACEAKRQDLRLEEIVEMPANNFALVFRRNARV